MGKSVLLHFVAERAGDWRILTADGVESEMELVYSGLHRLCAPLFDRLDRLPVPQRDALGTVFGLTAGPAPDRFLVGLATLTLLAEAADEQALLCLVDDAQWLDGASAQVLSFVARRLLAERIAFVCADRTGVAEDVFAGLPTLSIEGLSDSDARTLLLENVHGPLDAAVREQIIVESHGNPLALLELPRTWTNKELAGGFGLPESRPVVSKIEQSYAKRLLELPAETRLLVLAAAAEPLGDPLLLSRAVEILGLDMAAASAAADAALLKVGRRVEFAHPLARSAAYSTAGDDDRHRIHSALAEATDAEIDPERAAWHRAHATRGPDEDVAVELERSAGRAGARGGAAAAAAFLQRAVALSVDSRLRAERALAAAESTFQAGAFDAALQLVATAEDGPLDESQRARVDLLRGQIAFASGLSDDAPQLLLKAARRLERVDVDFARQTYLIAWVAASVVPGNLAELGILRQISGAILDLPPPKALRPLDVLLDALALMATEGRGAATPSLQQAANVLGDLPVEDVLSWGWMAMSASYAVWDIESAYAISARHVQLVRDAGALAQLPLYLAALGWARAWRGDLAGAASDMAEAESVAAVTGGVSAPWAALRVRALQGREVEATRAIASAIEQSAGGANNLAINAHWAAAVLYNGLARYEDAAAAARQAAAITFEYWVSVWVLPELVEAAARTGDTACARDALERLSATTQPVGNDAALGTEARCRALLEDGPAADALYREAIDRLTRASLRPDIARAHLVYGEWLRRAGRRIDARNQLRTAHDMFDNIGMEAFAERARRELLATGERVAKRNADTRWGLTLQEAQIAMLARDGHSNSEIAAQLFLSARTIEWHLSKVFSTLGISSRKELAATLQTET